MAATPAGLLTRMFGTAISGIAGFAGGTAIGPVLTPIVQLLRNDVNSHYPYVPPDPYQLAAGVAQGQVDPAQAAEWASMHGIGGPAFAALVNIANAGPAVGLAFQAWRRGELSDAEFDTALKRAAIEEEWYAALRSLKDAPLEPAEIAKAVHRGIMRDDGLLVVAPPRTAGKVAQVPESPIDPLKEAEWSGITAERLRVLVGNAGLPPGIVQMLQLLNRGEITEDDFLRGVGESNLRNEWGPAILALRRHLLTPHEYQEAALRGIIPRDTADAGSALSGMETGDAELLFEIMGRPLSVHQITTGLARGGQFGGSYSDIPEPYQDVVRRSNIRPEYARLAYANRYTLPSYFVIRALIQDGALTEAAAATHFRELGWPPELADAAAAAFSGSSGAGGKAETRAELADEYAGGFITRDEYQAALEALGYTGATLQLELELGDARLAKRYRDKVIEAIHQAYVQHEIDGIEAGSDLATVNVVGDAAARLIALWDLERRYTRSRLTQSQVVKAYGKGLIPEADALARLGDFGLSADDAAVRLAEG